MKLGVLNAMFGSKPLNETLAYLSSLGVETIEIGCGGYPGKAHCDPTVLLADEKALAKWQKTFKKYDIEDLYLASINVTYPDKVYFDKLRIELNLL